MITYDRLKNPFAGSLFLHDKNIYYSVGSIPEKEKWISKFKYL